MSTSRCSNVTTLARPDVATSPRHDIGKSSGREVGTSRRQDGPTLGRIVATLERRDVEVFDSNIMSSHIRSHHTTSCHITSRHVTSQHRNVATFQRRNVLGLDEQRWHPTSRRYWKFMSNVAMLDMNIATLLSFPATIKFQKSNLWDFYTLPSSSFFILTILDHLMTIYFNNNTRS